MFEPVEPLETQEMIDMFGEMTCGLCRKSIVNPPAVWIVYCDPDPQDLFYHMKCFEDVRQANSDCKLNAMFRNASVN